MTRSKITIFLSDLGGGGAEKVMLNLADGFVAENFAVDLVLVRKAGAYVSRINPKVKLVNLKGKSLFRSLPMLIRYLKKEQPSVLLSALEDTNVVAILAKWLGNRPTQVAVTVHNTLSQESLYANNLKRKFVPYIVPWLYLLADNVVTVSQGVAQDLIKLGLSEKKITVIYNPILTLELQTKLQQPLEHPWFFPQQPPVILGIGRLTRQKDFPTLIHSFLEVQKQIPLRLMILGEGEERTSLESLIRQLGIAENVLLLGFVQNPYVYMKQAKVVVLSSAWEGFGNVLVESMAAGTPVVSTDCPYGPNEILACGEYGRLVPVGDVDGMAKAIFETLQSIPDRKHLKSRAMDFNSEISVQNYLSLFNI